MAKAKSVLSTPPLNTSAPSALTQVAQGLFDLEERCLRVRDLTHASRMMAGSSEMSKEATDAFEALTSAILDEINEVIEERTRLCELAAKASDGGQHAQS
jgi:hypothetical protein